MQRRKFLTISSLALSIGINSKASPVKKDSQSFIVKSGNARFGVHTPFMGVNANDVKISAKIPTGNWRFLNMLAHRKWDLRFMYILSKMRFLRLLKENTFFRWVKRKKR